MIVIWISKLRKQVKMHLKSIWNIMIRYHLMYNLKNRWFLVWNQVILIMVRGIKVRRLVFWRLVVGRVWVGCLVIIIKNIWWIVMFLRLVLINLCWMGWILRYRLILERGRIKRNDIYDDYKRNIVYTIYIYSLIIRRIIIKNIILFIMIILCL